ncbi:MAG TPA: hypothetical protein H9866_07330 [Candidatus Tidjanibacter gallistercoris]|nr:hypothetical protein [Candidatus Tidjanibacter gallistercoris]
MKPVSKFTAALLAACASFSCTADKENAVVRHEPLPAVEYNQDLLVGDFAEALSGAIRENAAFRTLIKENVMLQFDGDYDLLLSQAADLVVEDAVTANGTRSGGSPVTVKNLIESYYPATRSAASPLDELQNMYPLLQISVPVHAEEWDPETYVPTVCFIPSDYQDLVTESVTGIDADGNIIAVDAINEPDVPVIVVGMNERTASGGGPLGPIGGGTGLKPIQYLAPSVVSGNYQAGAVRLSWENHSMGISPAGYRIYRAGPNNSTDFTLLATTGSTTKSYVDWNTVANKEYVYKVTAYYGLNTADSELLFITTNYTKPKKVEDLNVVAVGKRRIEISWTNPVGEMYDTHIERTSGSTNDDYETIAVLGPNEDTYFDTEVNPGEKYTYIVRKVDHQQRVSDAVRQYTYATYRNPDGPSGVYLKQISCDLHAVEGWLAGKPEFYVQVVGVTMSSDNKTIETPLGTMCDVQFASRSGNSQTLNHALLYSWSYFNHQTLYPALTFSLVEYDIPSATFDTTISVKAGYKHKDFIELSAAATLTLHFPHTDKHCGESSILYFENPEQWLDFPNYGAQILLSEQP